VPQGLVESGSLRHKRCHTYMHCGNHRGLGSWWDQHNKRQRTSPADKDGPGHMSCTWGY
jgi:hypothetical protein